MVWRVVLFSAEGIFRILGVARLWPPFTNEAVIACEPAGGQGVNKWKTPSEDKSSNLQGTDQGEYLRSKSSR